MKRANFPRRREQRHAEALERAAARAERTTEEQLQLLDERPGESRKERRRLT